MSKKDFELWAVIIADTIDDCNNGRESARLGINDTIHKLQTTYPNFDASKFRADIKNRLESIGGPHGLLNP